jgi:hypothetical protein
MTDAGCHCRRCWNGEPHEPVDELLILRALRHAGCEITLATRTLITPVDSSPPPKRGELAGCLPWIPRPPRKPLVPRPA